MEEWLKNLIDEHKQLVNRMVKISTDLSSGVVPQSQVDALEKQAYAMQGYETILRFRLLDAGALSVSAGVNPNKTWCQYCYSPLNAQGKCNCDDDTEVTYHPYLWKNEDGTESAS